MKPAARLNELGQSAWLDLIGRRLIHSGELWRMAEEDGVRAIRAATAAGISVNITLIFSTKVYEQVIEAYVSGLEDRVSRGQPISQIHSVASFFVSRVDTAVDKQLEAKGAKDLLGKIA